MEIKEQIKEKFKELKIKYPNLNKIEIEYNGSGDSFDSMFCFQNDIKEEDYEDLAWLLINQTDADFNDDGSEGRILIDLENEEVSIQNYYIIRDTELANDITFNLKQNDKRTNNSI